MITCYLLTAKETCRRYWHTATFTQRKFDDTCAAVYFRRYTLATWPVKNNKNLAF